MESMSQECVCVCVCVCVALAEAEELPFVSISLLSLLSFYLALFISHFQHLFHFSYSLSIPSPFLSICSNHLRTLHFTTTNSTPLSTLLCTPCPLLNLTNHLHTLSSLALTKHSALTSDNSLLPHYLCLNTTTFLSYSMSRSKISHLFYVMV